MDWYAAHLDEDVIAVAQLKTGAPPLFLGGGVTGLMQVPDVILRARLSSIYKRLEAEDHMRAVTLRPGKVPSWTKKDVMRRGTRVLCLRM